MHYAAYEIMSFLAGRTCSASVILKNTTDDQRLEIVGLDENNETGELIIEVEVLDAE